MIILLVIVGVIVLWLVSLYNNLVKLRNRRQNAFADIDVQLRQRHDLVPQLVQTVKGYASHESELLQKITEARSGAMNARTIDDKIVAEQQLSSALQEFYFCRGAAAANARNAWTIRSRSGSVGVNR